MKKKRRNFIKILIIKTIFLFGFTRSYSDHEFQSKKILDKRTFKKFVWYLDKNDK
tara:strand:- start:25107 stop:25271 length:165 start_codon:yes stop_codon:yes gene_type:complete